MNNSTTTKHTAEPWTLCYTDNLKEPTGEIISADAAHPTLIADTGIAHWLNLRAAAAHGAHAREWDNVIARKAADAARIVACVNACAGIEDPAAFMALVRDDLRRYSAMLEANAQKMEMGFVGLESLRALGG